MKYIVFDVVVDLGSASFVDNILKEVAFSRKIKSGSTMEYSDVIMPVRMCEDEYQRNQIEQAYGDFMWACFKDSKGECSFEEFFCILPLLENNAEILKYSTKIYVKAILSDNELGVVYFDGSMSSAGCSGVAIHCLEESPHGVYDTFSGTKRGYEAVGTVIKDNPTNNVGELNGMAFAVEFVQKGNCSHWVIIGDSEYTLKSFREWRFNWKNNGWKNSQGKTISNSALIELISEKIDSLKTNISFKWVKGHDGNPMNELCDLACKQMTGYV